MFTGIVRGIGRVAAIGGGDTRRLAIETGGLATTGWRIGDSIAVSGVCLTVVELRPASFEAELSPETLARTTLGRLRPGDAVNLEPAIGASDAFGGHFVTGHVDGVARVRAVEELGGSLRAEIEPPHALFRYLAYKGSVALDGVSLTVGEADGSAFQVSIIPHTRTATTLGALRAEQPVNIEVDIVSRYLERLLQAAGRP